MRVEQPVHLDVEFAKSSRSSEVIFLMVMATMFSPILTVICTTQWLIVAKGKGALTASVFAKNILGDLIVLIGFAPVLKGLSAYIARVECRRRFIELDGERFQLGSDCKLPLRRVRRVTLLHVPGQAWRLLKVHYNRDIWGRKERVWPMFIGDDPAVDALALALDPLTESHSRAELEALQLRALTPEPVPARDRLWLEFAFTLLLPFLVFVIPLILFFVYRDRLPLWIVHLLRWEEVTGRAAEIQILFYTLFLAAYAGSACWAQSVVRRMRFPSIWK